MCRSVEIQPVFLDLPKKKGVMTTSWSELTLKFFFFQKPILDFQKQILVATKQKQKDFLFLFKGLFFVHRKGLFVEASYFMYTCGGAV